MFSRFFIDRPVFATVLSVLIVVAGLVSIFNLPVARYPEITPPQVRIVATYPGANAETVAEALAAPIEQQLSGAKDLLYFSSQCTNDGVLTTLVSFEIGTNQDLAAVEVQNRVKLAEPRLPAETRRLGVSVQKTSSNILLVAAMRANDSRYDDLYLSNYATQNVADALKRVPGVGDVQVFGARDYAMRVWLDPERLAQKRLTVAQVRAKIVEQNGLYAAGRVGQAPNDGGTELTIPVVTRGRLQTAEEFENVVLRSDVDGSRVLLRDVGRAELGSQSYDLFGRVDGMPAAMMLVFLQSNANALDTADGVRAVVAGLAPSFPDGVSCEIPFDTTRFIRVSAREVIQTLLEAVGLVLLVVFVFLQSWRATLVPLLAVPVSIIGAFAGMKLFGFSINALTLFGLVLAIGIVVDDAIVVVENVERLMHEKHLSPRDATIEAMREVSGPVVAIVLVLSAVFVPVAFLGGLTGELYRQFAATIAISVAISGLVALTLSPALCRLLLRPKDAERSGPFLLFDHVFERITRGYLAGVRATLRGAVLALVLFGGLLFVAWRIQAHRPTGFLPQEDQGFYVVAAILPEGSSLARTQEVSKRVEEWVLSQPETEHVVLLGGQNLLSGGIASTNAFTMFVGLKHWEERTEPGTSVDALIGRFNQTMFPEKEGLVFAFNFPAVPGLGIRAGFEMQLQARGGADVRELGRVVGEFTQKLSARPEVSAVTANVNLSLPQLFVDVDRSKALDMGVPIGDVYDTMQAYLSQLYADDFFLQGRVYRVNLQAEPSSRRGPDDIGRFHVMNRDGRMVPLSELVTSHFQSGPNLVGRFNGYNAVQIAGAPGVGRSSGEALQAVREVAETLPPGFAIDFSGQTYQEIRTGNQALRALLFGVLVVFLVLAAQYESFSLPFAVLLAVPLGAFGALVAVWWRNLPLDIYFQIGLLTLVGLAAKNAILIVEFAVAQRHKGATLRDAALAAAKLRFRPIVMTSLAFIFGVLPLVIARGAGAAGRQSIGTGVMGGMIAATALAVFFVPLFFRLIEGASEKLFGRKEAPAE
ncbi:MAG: multidrug efflux RND transporter permease subunit [Planctomycetes bacterium]|nr:multidrug efflux RND transporter permease subunit [Planctomycetota bacterium]